METAPRSRTSLNRAALIAATRRNLMEQGLAGLAFERIAVSAGMTRKSVYNHFGSRIGLYEALMDDIGERAAFRRMAAIWDTDNPVELLERFFAEIVRAWDAERAMFRMMIGLSAADPELGAAVQARIGRVRGIASQLAARLAAAPGLRPGWTEADAAATLFALANFYTFDVLASDMSPAEAAGRLVALARVPFAWP